MDIARNMSITRVCVCTLHNTQADKNITKKTNKVTSKQEQDHFSSCIEYIVSGAGRGLVTCDQCERLRDYHPGVAIVFGTFYLSVYFSFWSQTTDIRDLGSDKISPHLCFMRSIVIFWFYNDGQFIQVHKSGGEMVL